MVEGRSILNTTSIRPNGQVLSRGRAHRACSARPKTIVVPQLFGQRFCRTLTSVYHTRQAIRTRLLGIRPVFEVAFFRVPSHNSD